MRTKRNNPSCKKRFPTPSPRKPYMAGGAIDAAEGPAERGVRRDWRVALLISPFSKGGYRGIFTSFLRRQESRILPAVRGSLLDPGSSPGSQVPTPSAKNSYMAGGRDSASVGSRETWDACPVLSEQTSRDARKMPRPHFPCIFFIFMT